jgi:hypothetical protein
MLFTFKGITQNFDLSCSFVAHYIVLDRMPLFLSAVILLLSLLIFGTADRAFCAIDNRFQPWTTR